MKRRHFLKCAGGAFAASTWLAAEQAAGGMDLSDCRIAISRAATAREARAVQVLVQEASKRCGIEWPVQTIDASRAKVTIYAGTRASWEKLGRRVTSVAQFAHDLPEDGFVLHSGHDIDGDWIAILGADERGL
jgi:hypothetical protein